MDTPRYDLVCALPFIAIFIIGLPLILDEIIGFFQDFFNTKGE